MRHTVSVLVENKSGVLARISALFAARGFNIASLSVSETEDPAISRMTIVVKGNESILEQVTKQLNKLVDVIKVNDFKDIEYIERELALIKVNAVNKISRDEIIRLAGVFRSRIIDISPESLIVEISGDANKINAFMRAILPYGVKETCKTGVSILCRGNSVKIK
ncbi:MAG: acetolactate synthase small subunit [Endomicrobium sp.]|jgi:acetolactate synthase-1/3 small subunit|nr:acetolactate synthase small subunit [Endomicrobium sp.]